MPPASMDNNLLANMAKNIEEMQSYLQTLDRFLNEIPDGQMRKSDQAHWLAPSVREKKLRAAIMEAINELEESRKSFKSKRLERLRKRLTQVLIESK